MSALVVILYLKRRGVIGMGKTERREALKTILAVRRHETISNLAKELGVSGRTIRRDLDELCMNEAIYTQSGRYGGGVYVLENFSANIRYFNLQELRAYEKVMNYIENNRIDFFTKDDIKLLKNILISHTKPKMKENPNE